MRQTIYNGPLPRKTVADACMNEIGDGAQSNSCLRHQFFSKGTLNWIAAFATWEKLSCEGLLTGRAAELPAFAALISDNVIDESTRDEAEKAAVLCPSPLPQDNESESTGLATEYLLESKGV